MVVLAVSALLDVKAVSGVSLRELEKRTGLPRTTVANALNGKRAWRPTSSAETKTAKPYDWTHNGTPLKTA
ncbi:hypothetical protein [Streptacidiphilus sp. MAP12-20]|uniref:hypothetical protein n=1 Tax=Streptacidiphilus sp. MAP12-20 TaxID=3156299 RepID=UPI0035137B51